jgi:hypothetical protein
MMIAEVGWEATHETGEDVTSGLFIGVGGEIDAEDDGDEGEDTKENVLEGFVVPRISPCLCPISRFKP